MICRTLSLLVFCATTACSLHAELLWPEFRGPTAQGHSTARGLPTEWAVDKNIVWRSEVPGRGWSSPIIANGRIFLTYALELGAAPASGVGLHAAALEAATGKLVWDKELFQQTDPKLLRAHQKNSHASPTPIFENGRIYVHFGQHGSACLTEAGEVLWTARDHPYSPVHGTGGSPVIVDELVIYNADAETDPGVIALDKATGKTRWEIKRSSDAKKKFSFCTPLVIEVAGQKQVISPGSGIVQALNPKDGSEIWHVMYDQGYSVVPRPVFAHGMIFLSTGYDKPVGMAIRVDAESKGDVTSTHVAWQETKYVPHNPSMLVVGDELYMLADNGLLSCRDAKTNKIYFEERLLGPSSASLLEADGLIFAIDEKGASAVVKPGQTLQVVARSELNEKTLASMAVCDNDLLIRTEKALYRVGKRQP